MSEAVVVVVPVANIWAEPGALRPVDAAAAWAEPDMRAWVGAMTHEDRLGLQGRLETQALLGERVTLLDERRGWARVVAGAQPSHKAEGGYPGWTRAEHLGPLPSGPTPHAPEPEAVVSVPLAAATRRGGGGPVQLSFGSRLEVVQRRPDRSLLRSPAGELLEVATDALVPVEPTGPAVLGAARRFIGLAYLWGGRSGYGADCSGLAHLAHLAAGITVPRDADDQSSAGVAVPAGQASAGDLLFFSRPGEAPHHVALCCDGRKMLHSPRTGRNVEEEDRASQPYASEQLSVARRYTRSNA